MDVDLRSESGVELGRLDAFFRRAAREAVEDETAARRPGAPPLELEVKLIGDRPGGTTPPEHSLVRLVAEATRVVGSKPFLDCSSTDSNIPISRGLPAVTIGAGGTSGSTHTLEEWYDPAGRDLGLKRALLLALGAVGLYAGGCARYSSAAPRAEASPPFFSSASAILSRGSAERCMCARPMFMYSR